MSRNTVKAQPGVNTKGDILEWFGMKPGSERNAELIVRRGELLSILEALERAKKKNTVWLRLRRWLAGKALVSLEPLKLTAMKRKEDAK